MPSPFAAVSSKVSPYLPLPTRRNAAITMAIIVLFYLALYWAVIVRQGDMDTLRIGAYRNEVFNVGGHETQPYLTLMCFGAIPLVLAVYCNYFFLNPIGLTAVSAGAQQNVSGCSSALVQPLSTLRAKASLFAVAVIASFYCVLSLMSTFALICNYPLSDMSKLCTFSSDVMETIRARHGKDSVWLFKGTLIGALRANKKHNSMILNDHDYDICYDRKLESVILETVRSVGATYERVSRNEGRGNDEFIRIYPTWATLMAGHSGPNKIELEACDPQTTTMVTGCNGLPVAIPDNYDAYLTKEYGSDWRIPKMYNHGGLCAAFPGW